MPVKEVFVGSFGTLLGQSQAKQDKASRIENNSQSQPPRAASEYVINLLAG